LPIYKLFNSKIFQLPDIQHENHCFVVFLNQSDLWDSKYELASKILTVEDSLRHFK